jgi:hypothetical protein
MYAMLASLKKTGIKLKYKVRNSKKTKLSNKLIPTFRLVYIGVIIFFLSRGDNHLCFINVRMCLFLCSAQIELGH